MTNKIPNPDVFIKEELTNLIKYIPNVSVKYQYDVEFNSHYIEVLPKELFNDNKEYICLENEITDKFISLFPNQSICFITEDSYIKLENVVFELNNFM